VSWVPAGTTFFDIDKNDSRMIIKFYARGDYIPAGALTIDRLPGVLAIEDVKQQIAEKPLADRMETGGHSPPASKVAHPYPIGSPAHRAWLAEGKHRAAAAASTSAVTADEILQRGADHIRDRAATRDKSDGERTMQQIVAAFNAIFGTELTEEQGWQFMVLLKIVRSANGKVNIDDYEDEAAYAALAAEAALTERG
jgi:hypothetical protein